MNKSEAKFHNAAMKMHKSLFELLDEKDFAEINVKEICEKAKVNRSTFYAHYNNTRDLLLETKENFVKDFFSKFELKKETINELSPEDSNFITDKYLQPYLQFIKENKKFYKIFMQNLHVLEPDDVMTLLMDYVFIPILKKHNMNDENIIAYLARYYLTGITSIIGLWLGKDCIDDINLIIEIIIMCVRPNDKIWLFFIVK